MVLQRIGNGAGTVLLAGFSDPVAKPAAAPAQPPKATTPNQSAVRRSAVTPCVSSGRWTPPAGSPSARKNSPASSAPGSEIVSGRPWSELNAELGLDPAGRVAQAVASRETWSNITISWPIDGSDERLEVELAGLPSFDRSRNFLGYRGFGVCRDIAHIERLATTRQLATGAVTPPSHDCVRAATAAAGAGSPRKH